MKYEIQAVKSDALVLGEMRARVETWGRNDTVGYDGIEIDYVMAEDAVRVIGFVQSIPKECRRIADLRVEDSDPIKEAFWVLADMLNVDTVLHGSDEYHITWVKRLPRKEFAEYVEPKRNYFKQVAFLVGVLAVLCLPFIAAGWQEQKLKQKLEVSHRWYEAHPDADILIFNCINDDMEVKCPSGAEKRFEK